MALGALPSMIQRLVFAQVGGVVGVGVLAGSRGRSRRRVWCGRVVRRVGFAPLR